MRRALVLVPLLLLGSVVSAQDEASLLARLESADEDVRDAAEDEWDELDEATQVRLARAALADPEAPGAIAAAHRLSPWSLDLDELHRQALALLRDPELEIVEHGLPACIGAPEVLDVWRVAGERTAWYEELHRVTTEDHLAALVAAAEEAPDATWESRFWTVNLVAQLTDTCREGVAALHAENVLRWDGEDLAPASPAGSGLPPRFETLMRCAWRLPPFHQHGEGLGRSIPWYWRMRWVADVTPTAADLPFLDEVVVRCDDEPEACAWALRHRVRLSGDGAAAWLAALHDDPEGPDCEAELAAHLALLGDRSRWDALVARDPEAARTTPLLWDVDRDAASAAAAEGAFGLDVQERARLAAFWGVHVGREDLDAVAALLAAKAADAEDDDVAGAVEALVAFHRGAYPDGVRGAGADALVTTLERVTDEDDAPAGDDLRVVLGLLEVRARDRLVPLLRAWSGGGEALREIAVNALLELGEDVDVDLAWHVWSGADGGDSWDDETTIGLHRDPAIGERLRDAASSGHERADDAVAALARRAGLSRYAASAIRLFVGDVEDATRASVLAALGSERPADAVRFLYEATEEPLLVMSLDPEVLRELRAHRENGLYWRATLGLAVAGEPDAYDEIARLLRENRTPLMDDFAWPDEPRTGRAFARLHAERLAHNCCSRFQGATALRFAYPTMPVEDGWVLFPQREIALAWLDAHEADAVFSAIANAWLPR